mgnify:CR=1 FL=1
MNKQLDPKAYETATRDFFDKMASDWDEKVFLDTDKVNTVFKIAGVPENARILDVACGTGVLIPSLLESHPEYVAAIDLSPAMIEVARSKYTESCLSIQTGNFYEFEERGFDLITVYNAYPHFQDKAGFFRQAYNLLNPKGRLLVFHGSGREEINACHKGEEEVERISTVLKPCQEEKLLMEQLFRVDVIIDTEEYYVLSGIRR